MSDVPRQPSQESKRTSQQPLQDQQPQDQQPQDQPPQDQQPQWLKVFDKIPGWTIPIAFAALVALAYVAIPSFQDFVDKAYRLIANERQDAFQQWIEGYGAWAPIILMAVMLLQTIIPVIPSVVIMVAAVLAFGVVWGSVLSWLGLLAAACLAYVGGRLLGPATIYRLIGAKTENRLEAILDDYGMGAVVFARVSPVLSTDAISFVAGLIGMRFWHFLAATAVGTLPLLLLIAVLARDFNTLERGLLVMSIVSALMFVAYLGYQAWQKRQN
jgi:uncharacterized membrane protein YdjX (TVP38/TMEM64 family)